MTEIKIGNKNDILKSIQNVAIIKDIEVSRLFLTIKVIIGGAYMSAQKLTTINKVMESYGYEFKEIAFSTINKTLNLYYFTSLNIFRSID